MDVIKIAISVIGYIGLFKVFLLVVARDIVAGKVEILN